MARKFLTPIDLGKLELQNARVQNLPSAPSNPVEGQIYYDTTVHAVLTWNGAAWISASQGTQGTQGIQGIQGTQGIQGIQGNDGTQGLQGEQGIQGTQGEQGIQGIQGEQGITGAQGTSGYVGSDGAQGTQGIQGEQGLQGEQGIQGTQGITGDQGTQGIQGLQGEQGIQGVQGEQGIQGIQGTQGDNAGIMSVGSGLNLDGMTGALTVDENVIATKSYADSIAQGLSVLGSVIAASDANIDLTSAITTTIGGVELNDGNRVLVKSQDNATQNGIYVFNGTTNMLVASTNLEDTALKEGSYTLVTEGAYAAQGWIITAFSAGASTWTQFSAAGEYITSVSSEFDVTSKTLSLQGTLGGKTFAGDVYFQSPGGAGGSNNSITVDNGTGHMTVSSGYELELQSTNGVNITSQNSDIVLNADGNVYIATAATGNEVATHGWVEGQGYLTTAVQKYATTITGDSTDGGMTGTTQFTVTHNLGTTDIVVTVWDTTTAMEVVTDVMYVTNSTVTIGFAVAPITTQAYRVVVQA